MPILLIRWEVQFVLIDLQMNCWKEEEKKVLCRLETFGSKARLVNITKPGLGW